MRANLDILFNIKSVCHESVGWFSGDLENMLFPFAFLLLEVRHLKITWEGVDLLNARKNFQFMPTFFFF